MSNKVSAVIVFDRKRERFLILRRSSICRSPGLWNFPGGSLDEGECYEEAGARELFEESSLETSPDSLTYLSTLVQGKLIIKIFSTDDFSGEVSINKESSDFKWIDISEFQDYNFVGGGEIHPVILDKLVVKYLIH